MVSSLVATISSTCLMTSISAALLTLSVSYFSLQVAHCSILACFFSWETLTHSVFSANLFSYKAREASFCFFKDSASDLAAVTFFLVPSISATIYLN